MSAKLPPGTLAKLWSDPANWSSVGIYSCKADPRVMVPKRFKWMGWTMNFAHAAAWACLLGGMLYFLALIYVALKLDQLTFGVPLVIGGVLLAFLLPWWLASPRRFEDRQ